MTPSSPAELTHLLALWRQGDPRATDELIPLVYDDLRRIAESQFRRESAGHTLQPTALVHEAWLRLAEQTRVTWQNREHFFGVAAQVMRRILVDHARRKQAEKRGGEAMTISLSDVSDWPAAAQQGIVNTLAVDAALGRLGELDARQARIVEMRFFAGMSAEEIAAALGLSERTIKREWRSARAFLLAELEGA